MPDAEARLAMVQRCFQKVHLAPDVDLAAVAEGLAGATGADITHACREALMLLLRRDLAQDQAAAVTNPHAARHGMHARSAHAQHAHGAAHAAAGSTGADDSDMTLTAEDLEATVGRARRSVSTEEVARFEGMRDALATGSLPPPPPRGGRGGSEQVERLAKAMLKERAAARIAELQGLLRDAAGLLQEQRAALEARGATAVVDGADLGSSEMAGHQGGVWDKVMAAVASLGDADAGADDVEEGAEEDAVMVE